MECEGKKGKAVNLPGTDPFTGAGLHKGVKGASSR
jgi:hypothetical protein